MSEFSSTPKSALMLTFSYTARGRGRFFVSSFRHTRDRRKKSCRTELPGLTNCAQIGSPSGGRNSNYKWLVWGIIYHCLSVLCSFSATLALLIFLFVSFLMALLSPSLLISELFKAFFFSPQSPPCHLWNVAFFGLFCWSAWYKDRKQRPNMYSLLRTLFVPDTSRTYGPTWSCQHRP